MFRTLLGYAALAIIGFVAMTFVFKLLGFAVSLFMTVLWFAVIGFLFYLLLRLVSPGTARRVRDMIRGH